MQAGSTGTEKRLKSAFSWRSEESPKESHGPGSETDGAENSQHGLSWYQHFLGNLCLVNMKIKKIKNNKVVCEAWGYDWGSIPPVRETSLGSKHFWAGQCPACPMAEVGPCYSLALVIKFPGKTAVCSLVCFCRPASPFPCLPLCAEPPTLPQLQAAGTHVLSSSAPLPRLWFQAVFTTFSISRALF